MANTPQFKIRKGKKMIAQAYDAYTAAYIAISYNAEVSYLYRRTVWNGAKEEMIYGLDNNSLERVAAVINRRVQEFWDYEKDRIANGYLTTRKATIEMIEINNNESQLEKVEAN